MGIRNRDKKGRFAETHGYHDHPLYSIWYGMMNRCYNPNNIRYKRYGGRGISVCNRWHDVKNFCNDLEKQYIKGLTIDRINGDGNYDPTNVQFLSLAENSGKTCRTRINKVLAGKIKNLLRQNIKHRLIAQEYNLPIHIIKDISAKRVWL